ncbi:hypothetical protein J2I48_25575 [Fibrella sp. HMF5036]|uniref:Uncharacterized protein n=2 Tax=Fibrella aquatilis TaxID=2817059 RepID=A0A939K3J3_9BACT|nr:hypothetical protein [Fibrella aquatilis]
MEPEKEQRINHILGSLTGMQRAEPGPFLYAKIRHRLVATATPVVVSRPMVWLVAAAFSALVLLNWRAMGQPSGADQADPASLDAVVTSLQLFPSNQPY